MSEWDAEVQALADEDLTTAHYGTAGGHHSRRPSSSSGPAAVATSGLHAGTSTLKRIINGASSTSGGAGSGAGGLLHNNHASAASSSSTSISSLTSASVGGIPKPYGHADGGGVDNGGLSLSTSPSKLLPPGLKKLRKRTSQNGLARFAKKAIYEPRTAWEQVKEDPVSRARFRLSVVVCALLLLIGWRSGWWSFGSGLGSSSAAAAALSPAGRGSSHQKLKWGIGATSEVANWGDHVGLGRARQDVLERTPRPYTDIGDHWTGASTSGGRRSNAATLYFKRRTLEEIRQGKPVEHHEPGEDDPDAGHKAKRNWDFERDRHGIMGGASVEWSKGVVGSGKYLGEVVDMRKDGSYDSDDSDERRFGSFDPVTGDDRADDLEAEMDDDDNSAGRARDRRSPSANRAMAVAERGQVHKAERRALVDHILEHGWEYLDAEDKENTEKLLYSAKKEGFVDKLPLRDRVRGHPQLMEEAATGWARIYTAHQGEWQKSALEIALEKMARRVPIIVFSKTTCP